MSLEFLTAQGWQAKRHTLTTFQTYLWGTLFALPFILLAGGMYRMFLFDRAVLLDHTGLIGGSVGSHWPDPAGCYYSQCTVTRSPPWFWMETGRTAAKR